MTPPTKAFLVGGGIANLSTAVYLIRHAQMNPADITILENMSVVGGAMDAGGEVKKGYVTRGSRMFDKDGYPCLFDLLDGIPSLVNPGKTCHEDIVKFSLEFPNDSHARLMDEGQTKPDVTQLGVSLIDNARFGNLLVCPESMIESQGIEDWFSADFFTTNFWYCMRSTFAFQPWHSLIEFKRYCLYFVHEVPRLYNLGGVFRSPYNQYESIIVPTTEWLKDQGVKFQFDTEVTSVDFEIENDARSIYRINLKHQPSIPVSKTDRVFLTIGSMTASASFGDMTHPVPPLIQSEAEKDPTWLLWKDIAKRQPDFGNPQNFFGDVNKSKFLSFSLSCYDIEGKPNVFRQQYNAWTTDPEGQGGLITFKHSDWKMNIVMYHQPYFAKQPKDVTFLWGYALAPDACGNYVKKPMSECTGAEILTEICHMMGFTASSIPEILDTCVLIPSMLPYTMSQFVKRKTGDRPAVIPKKATNFAFLGQYVEIPDGVVFTVEYSVRCAQMAVFGLCGVDKEPTSMYKGWKDPFIMAAAAKAMLS
ncbi:hypothetical protein HDU98_001768 [Podochytrium sp. JEL0797]|nr:hypothetical protein HDU98_001768 [Podochytrium sp. JEL0797]